MLTNRVGVGGLALGGVRLYVGAMAKKDVSWKVLQHGPARAARGQHLAGGRRAAGMSLRRTMTVVRRGDGSLLLHSPIALDDGHQRELEALGSVKVIVVPQRRSSAGCAGVQGSLSGRLLVRLPRAARVTKVAEVVAVDLTYEDYADDGIVRFETLAGVGDAEGAMVVTSPTASASCSTDVVMNMDTKKDVLGYLFTTVVRLRSRSAREPAGCA